MQEPSPRLSTQLDITKTSGENLWLDRGFTWLVLGFACVTVVLLIWITWIIFQNAQPAIEKFGVGF